MKYFIILTKGKFLSTHLQSQPVTLLNVRNYFLDIVLRRFYLGDNAKKESANVMLWPHQMGTAGIQFSSTVSLGRDCCRRRLEFLHRFKLRIFSFVFSKLPFLRKFSYLTFRHGNRNRNHNTNNCSAQE